MGTEQFQILLRFLKALADESRLKIVGILANQECSVEELAALLQLKEPTVSHHLGKLKEVNLVNMRVEGNTHFYQLDRDTLENMTKEMFTSDKIASLITDIDTEAWENKVLNNYLDGDFLKGMPVSWKKRLVILKWLANKFEIGVDYPENTVNEILGRHYTDSNTLLQDLITYQLMKQENDVYLRLPES
ncbi:MAG: metalloregulator ArsR/SmtB family transcription factor [Nostocaceae cyanobacterium]|nr:metalloregulator ArsR/SmtB family transcription factor [Nostocaceae cyanobacterium]